MTRIGLIADLPPHALESGRSALNRALQALGDVQTFPVGRGLADALAVWRPDLAFNAARRPASPAERHQVPAILEALGIPVAGSGSAALAVTASRPRLKEALAARQVPSPAYTIVHDPSELAPFGRRSFPLAIFRPTDAAGADKAVVAEDAPSLEREARTLWAREATPLLIERHLAGEAFACVALGNGDDRAMLPPVALRAGHGDGLRVEYVPEGLREEVEQVVLDACAALDLRDCARVDVTLTDTGIPQVVGVDALPDLNPAPGNPLWLATQAAGMDDVELIQRWLLLAAARTGVVIRDAPAFDAVWRRTPPRGLRLRQRPA